MDRSMKTLEHTIEVEAPVRATYNQWTQFEDFPRFMEGVRSVEQLDDTHVHWVAEIAGTKKEWDAEITRQVPDTEIDWIGSVIRTIEAGSSSNDRRSNKSDDDAGLRPAGTCRRDRRQAWLGQATRQRRHGALQTVPRGTRQRNGWMARTGQPRLSENGARPPCHFPACSGDVLRASHGLLPGLIGAGDVSNELAVVQDSGRDLCGGVSRLSGASLLRTPLNAPGRNRTSAHG